MSAKIVNLRRARKAKARAETAREAARNRVVHGRTKAQRRQAEAEAEREARAHDGHRLSDCGPDDDERGGGPT